MKDDIARLGSASTDVAQTGLDSGVGKPANGNDSGTRPFAVGDRVIWGFKGGARTRPGTIVAPDTNGYHWVLDCDTATPDMPRLHVFESELEHLDDDPVPYTLTEQAEEALGTVRTFHTTGFLGTVDLAINTEKVGVCVDELSIEECEQLIRLLQEGIKKARG